jgi:hypothetical protein
VPLAIAVALIGAATWFLLTRGWAIGPWLLAALLIAHGALHLLFVVPQPEARSAPGGGMPWPFDMGRSWLIHGAGLEVGVVRLVGTAVMAIVFAGFVLAALSTLDVLVPAEWWAGLVAGSAVGSIVLLTAFFSPSFLVGYGIDLAMLWLVFASVWSPSNPPS